MSKRIFCHLPDFFASGFYRAKLPVLQCYHTLSKENISLHLDHEIAQTDTNFDAYIFHRQLPDQLLWFVNKLKQEFNKKIVIAYDDDLRNFPEFQPHASAFADKSRLNLMNGLADEIWVSTQTLANTFDNNLLKKIKILPNLIDSAVFPSAEKVSSKYRPTLISWFGSNFHEKDLNLLVPAIKQIIAQQKHKVIFNFYGDCPSDFTDWQRLPDRSDLAQVVIKEQYQTFITYTNRTNFKLFFPTLANINPDIVLCPLLTDTYNQSKSNLKILEGTMVGAACVATNCQPYHDFRKSAILVNNDEDDWYEAITRLINDKTLRQTLHSHALDKVRKDFSWNDTTRQVWLNAFKGLV